MSSRYAIPYEDALAAVERINGKPCKPAGRGHSCCCIGHHDRTASLWLAPKRDGADTLFVCHAGCNALALRDIVRAAL